MSLLVVAVLVLFGCSNEPEMITKCSLVVKGNNLEHTLTSKGDDVIEEKIVQIFEWDNAFTGSLIKTTIDGYKTQYANIKGLTYNVTEEENKLMTNLVVNYKEVDLKEFQEKVLRDTSGKKITGMSLENTVEALSKSGLTCTKG